jgi:hypothetical protein
VPLSEGECIQADDTIPGGQHIARSGTGTDAGIALRHDAPVLVEQAWNLRSAQHRLLGAHIDEFAVAVAGAANDRQQGACRGVGTSERLGDSPAGLQRFPFGYPAQLGPAAHRAGDQMR